MYITRYHTDMASLPTETLIEYHALPHRAVSAHGDINRTIAEIYVFVYVVSVLFLSLEAGENAAYVIQLCGVPCQAHCSYWTQMCPITTFNATKFKSV